MKYIILIYIDENIYIFSDITSIVIFDSPNDALEYFKENIYPLNPVFFKLNIVPVESMDYIRQYIASETPQLFQLSLISDDCYGVSAKSGIKLGNTNEV
jgi:hypothetical protein